MNDQHTSPAPVAVLDGADRVGAVLPPLRRAILGRLAERTDSATGLAKRLDLTRQKVNYHLRELEKAGLVECVEKRQRRGCVERCLRPTARAWVVSPAFLGELSAEPDQLADRFSSAYLMAVASRTLRDVAVARERAAAVDRRLVTLTLDTEISFVSPAAMSAFADELTAHVGALVAKYHQPDHPGARRHRVAVGVHPVITKSEAEAAAESAEARRDTPTSGKETS